MLAKALWAKEYQQVKALLWSTFGVVVGGWPLAVLMEVSNVKREAAIFPELLSSSNLMVRAYGYESLPALFTLLVVALGCLLIGSERGRSIDEFTLSLPFSRGQIYLTKWLLGSGTIVASLTISAVLADVVIKTSGLLPYLMEPPRLWAFWWQFTLLSLAVFTLALFLGTISGGPGYQAALSLIFILFPFGFSVLMAQLLYANGLSTVVDSYIGETVFQFAADFTLGVHAAQLGSLHPISRDGWLYVLPYIIALLPWGIKLYTRNPVEQNGRLLVFPGMRRFFLAGITLCFGLLGGLIFSWSAETPLSYYTGFTLFAALFYWLADKLLHPQKAARQPDLA